jgi:hypothetical protein
MPIQSVQYAWLFVEVTSSSDDVRVSDVKTQTINFTSQSVFAQSAITTFELSQDAEINAQIQSYTKGDGTVVDLSADPKNNAVFDNNVVSVTFRLQATTAGGHAKVWSSGIVFLFG